MAELKSQDLEKQAQAAELKMQDERKAGRAKSSLLCKEPNVACKAVEKTCCVKANLCTLERDAVRKKEARKRNSEEKACGTVVVRREQILDALHY